MRSWSIRNDAYGNMVAFKWDLDLDRKKLDFYDKLVLQTKIEKVVGRVSHVERLHNHRNRPIGTILTQPGFTHHHTNKTQDTDTKGVYTFQQHQQGR